MMQFNIKNLPKGFVYIAPKRVVRPMVERFADIFTSVDYDGISMSEQNVSKWETERNSRRMHLGILYSQTNENDNVCKFRLKLNGIREVNLPENQEEIVGEMLAGIESKITQIITLPSTASRKVGNLFFGFSVSKEKQEGKYFSFIAY